MCFSIFYFSVSYSLTFVFTCTMQDFFFCQRKRELFLVRFTDVIYIELPRFSSLPTIFECTRCWGYYLHVTPVLHPLTVHGKHLSKSQGRYQYQTCVRYSFIFVIFLHVIAIFRTGHCYSRPHDSRAAFK